MEMVGHYPVTAELGRGSYGVVFLGSDPGTGAPVAIKVFDASSPQTRDLLRREAASLTSVRSPNTLQVVEVIDTTDVLALVTDYVPGATLRDVLDTYGSLTPAQALQVLWGAAAGLAAVHAAGLVHGDVKPANILVTPGGESKLIDFGLVGVAGLTNPDGSLSGSPAYSAPEQWGTGVRDARCDIYALSVTLFELLTGQRPYVGGSVAEIVEMHASAPVPDPRDLNPGVGQYLAELCMAGMAKNPASRPQDVATFLAGLEAGADQQVGAQWRTPGLLTSVAVGALAGGSAASGVIAALSTQGVASAIAPVVGAAAAPASSVTGHGASQVAGHVVKEVAKTKAKSSLLTATAGKVAAAVTATAVVATGGTVGVLALTHSGPFAHHGPGPNNSPTAIESVDFANTSFAYGGLLGEKLTFRNGRAESDGVVYTVPSKSAKSGDPTQSITYANMSGDGRMVAVVPVTFTTPTNPISQGSTGTQWYAWTWDGYSAHEVPVPLEQSDCEGVISSVAPTSRGVAFTKETDPFDSGCTMNDPNALVRVPAKTFTMKLDGGVPVMADGSTNAPWCGLMSTVTTWGWRSLPAGTQLQRSPTDAATVLTVSASDSSLQISLGDGQPLVVDGWTLYQVEPQYSGDLRRCGWARATAERAPTVAPVPGMSSVYTASSTNIGPSTAAEAEAQTQWPVDLRSAMAAFVTPMTGSCHEGVNIDIIDPRGYAGGGEGSVGPGCGGGAEAIWVHVNGTWVYAGGTQSQWNCADLRRYDIPVSVASAQAGTSSLVCGTASGYYVNYTRS